MSENESKLAAKLKRGRPKVTHGGYSFIATGRLPEHRVYLLRYLSAAREGLVCDLGGEENLSTAEVILIDRITSKLGIIRCIEEHIKESSVMQGSELAPSLKKSYLAYSNSLRLDLLALGVDKKQTGEVLDLDHYVAEKYRKKEKV